MTGPPLGMKTLNLTGLGPPSLFTGEEVKEDIKLQEQIPPPP